MSAKSIRFRELARFKMFAGVNMLADAVKVTLDRADGRCDRDPRPVPPAVRRGPGRS
jgi:hypothetical protein